MAGIFPLKKFLISLPGGVRCMSPGPITAAGLIIAWLILALDSDNIISSDSNLLRSYPPFTEALFIGESSFLGLPSVEGPIASQLPVNTIFFTPAESASSQRFLVPLTFISKNSSGSLFQRRFSAAQWTQPVHPESAFFTNWRSLTSPRIFSFHPDWKYFRPIHHSTTWP